MDSYLPNVPHLTGVLGLIILGIVIDLGGAPGM